MLLPKVIGKTTPVKRHDLLGVKRTHNTIQRRADDVEQIAPAVGAKLINNIGYLDKKLNWNRNPKAKLLVNMIRELSSEPDRFALGSG